MSAVDVLAVMDRSIEILHGNAWGEDREELSEARAAVAELIAADRAFDHAMECRIHASNLIVSGDRSDDAFRRKCSADHAYDRAADRRRAALARLSGAPQ